MGLVSAQPDRNPDVPSLGKSAGTRHHDALVEKSPPDSPVEHRSGLPKRYAEHDAPATFDDLLMRFVCAWETSHPHAAPVIDGGALPVRPMSIRDAESFARRLGLAPRATWGRPTATDAAWSKPTPTAYIDPDSPRDADGRPLIDAGSWLAHAAHLSLFQYVEASGDARHGFVVVEVDDGGGWRERVEALAAAGAAPTYVGIRLRGEAAKLGRCQLVWSLSVPVMADNPRSTALLTQVRDALRDALGGDEGFSHCLSRNPLYVADDGAAEYAWWTWAGRSYKLHDLLDAANPKRFESGRELLAYFVEKRLAIEAAKASPASPEPTPAAPELPTEPDSTPQRRRSAFVVATSAAVAARRAGGEAQPATVLAALEALNAGWETHPKGMLPVRHLERLAARAAGWANAREFSGSGGTLTQGRHLTATTSERAALRRFGRRGGLADTQAQAAQRAAALTDEGRAVAGSSRSIRGALRRAQLAVEAEPLLASGLSQRAVAARLGVSQPTLSRALRDATSSDSPQGAIDAPPAGRSPAPVTLSDEMPSKPDPTQTAQNPPVGAAESRTFALRPDRGLVPSLERLGGSVRLSHPVDGPSPGSSP